MTTTIFYRCKMKYTINGKEYTEFDINKRCAELMDLRFQIYGDGTVHMGVFDLSTDKYFLPSNKPADTWPIIEKCFDKLMLSVNDGGYSMGNLESIYNLFGTKWDYLIEKHKCTKLVAACICFIEINEVQHDSTI
jgi:hypothetical protein